jgi:hypothetical protein
MNDSELREIAKATVAGLLRLAPAEDLSAEEAEETRAALETTLNYWHKLAYPELYRQPTWYVRLWRWLMDRRHYRVN